MLAEAFGLESEIQMINSAWPNRRYIWKTQQTKIFKTYRKPIKLVKNLNIAIPAADKQLLYEAKVNFLVDETTNLKSEISEMKSKFT